MRVFVNYLRYSRNRADTDKAYSAQLAALSEFDRQIAVVFNDSRLSAWIADLAGRLSITRLSHPRYGPIARIIAFFARNTVIFPWQLHDVDVVWAHWFFPWLLTAKKIPVLFSSGFSSNEYAGVRSDAERRQEVKQLLRRFASADLVSFPARSWIDHFNAIDASLADKIIFLPPLLRVTELPSSQDVEQKFAAASGLRLLFVGRDGERKGLYELQQALVDLVQQHPAIADSLQVTIVSETACPPVAGMHIRYFDSLPRERALELMRESHIFCLPTKRDAYGFVFLEAMASGCVIIADNRDPRTEILDDGRCGIMTDTTPANIAGAIATVTANSCYARQLAVNAWQRYTSTYSYALSVRQHIENLRELAGR